MNGSNILLDGFKQLVATGSVKEIRSSISSSMMMDKTFAECDAALEYAENNGVIGLIVDHDDTLPMLENRADWDKDYFGVQSVMLIDNFSRKRIEHVKDIIRKLYPDDRLTHVSQTAKTSTSVGRAADGLDDSCPNDTDNFSLQMTQTLNMQQGNNIAAKHPSYPAGTPRTCIPENNSWDTTSKLLNEAVKNGDKTCARALFIAAILQRHHDIQGMKELIKRRGWIDETPKCFMGRFDGNPHSSGGIKGESHYQDNGYIERCVGRLMYHFSNMRIKHMKDVVEACYPKGFPVEKYDVKNDVSQDGISDLMHEAVQRGNSLCIRAIIMAYTYEYDETNCERFDRNMYYIKAAMPDITAYGSEGRYTNDYREHDYEVLGSLIFRMDSATLEDALHSRRNYTEPDYLSVTIRKLKEWFSALYY